MSRDCHGLNEFILSTLFDGVQEHYILDRKIIILSHFQRMSKLHCIVHQALDVVERLKWWTIEVLCHLTVMA